MSSQVEEEPLSIDELPGPRPSLPFIGTTWMYYPWIGRYRVENLHEANVDKYYRYGRISREEYVYRHPVVQLYHPEDIEQVLRNQGKFPWRPPNEAAVLFRRSRPDMYNTVGLVNASGEEWHRLRGILASYLVQPRVVNDFIPKQNSVCDDLIRLLKRMSHPDGTVDNVMEPLHRMALESTAMFCLEKRLGCLEDDIDEGSDARRMIDASLSIFQAYQSLYYGSQLWKYVTTAAYRQMANAEQTLYSIVSEYIDKVKSEFNIEEVDNCPTMVQLIVKSEGDDFKDVRTGIVDLITAGIDTSANSIVLLLNQLARNPQIQETLYREIESRVGQGEPTVDTLSEMPYLKACVKEAFRLCPTIPNIVRILTDDMILSGYLIPKGTTVICQTMISSQLSDYVVKAKDFLPERWLPGDPNRFRSFTVQPFGCGPRMCPGRRFAEQEIYLTLIKIIQKFRVEFVKEMQVQYMFIITPKSPVTLRFVPRH